MSRIKEFFSYLFNPRKRKARKAEKLAQKARKSREELKQTTKSLKELSGEWEKMGETMADALDQLDTTRKQLYATKSRISSAKKR